MMTKFRDKLKNNDGFTLVELIVVIAVLGILAGIAVPRLTGVQDKAHQAEAVQALGTIKDSLEMYYSENNSYPADEATLSDSDVLGQYIDNFEELLGDWNLAYNYTDDTNFNVTLSWDGEGSVGNVVLKKSDSGYEVTKN